MSYRLDGNLAAFAWKTVREQHYQSTAFRPKWSPIQKIRYGHYRFMSARRRIAAVKDDLRIGHVIRA